MERVEDYIWSRIDETQYLRDVVADEALNCEQLLSAVEAVQRNLNTQLRQGVEENYPRLLEQVSAIEILDEKQVHFDKEMQTVSQKAEQLAQLFGDNVAQLRTDVCAIRNLTLLNRLLGDSLRCEELVNSWRSETDLIRQAEIVHELNALLRDNDRLRSVKFVNVSSLFRLNEMTAKTKAAVMEHLRAALAALNSAAVNGQLKALHHLYDHQPAVVQKELNGVMNEAVRELDALFLQLSGQGGSSAAGGGSGQAEKADERCGRTLAQIGNRLHSYLEQYQLLGMENAQNFARSVCKIIAGRVAPSAPYAIRLMQTVYKCLLTHPESVSKLVRDALHPLKVSVLSQSLSNLFAAVDDAFTQDEKKATLIVEKLNLAMKSELQSVNWDADLLCEMEANVAKTLRYISTKVEQQLQFTDETLRLGARVSRQQAANYQMLSTAHSFIKMWPNLAQSMSAIIDANVEALLTRYRSTVALVLASMHNENMTTALPAGASSSLYMKELCDHLKVFRVHTTQIQPLVESVDALPNFLNHVIEQFLLHISLIRPLSTSSGERFAKDLEYMCRHALQQFNCKSARLLNAYQSLSDFIVDAASNFADFGERTLRLMSTKGNAVPAWFAVHMLINTAGPEVPLPHDSASWSLTEFVDWFNAHATAERFKFYRNLMLSYQQSVIAQNATEYVRSYPAINDLIERNL